MSGENLAANHDEKWNGLIMAKDKMEISCKTY